MFAVREASFLFLFYMDILVTSSDTLFVYKSYDAMIEDGPVLARTLTCPGSDEGSSGRSDGKKDKEGNDDDAHDDEDRENKDDDNDDNDEDKEDHDGDDKEKDKEEKDDKDKDEDDQRD